MSNYKINGNILTGIADGIRTAGDLDTYQSELAEIKEELEKIVKRNGTSITITTTEIGDFAFTHYDTLTTVIFKSDLQSIGRGAFSNCARLVITSLPDSVETIGRDCFNNSQKIALTSLPKKLKQLDGWAFQSCWGLKHIDMSKVEQVPVMTNDAFGATSCTFGFRDQAQFDEYANATNWSKYVDRFRINNGGDVNA